MSQASSAKIPKALLFFTLADRNSLMVSPMVIFLFSRQVLLVLSVIRFRSRFILVINSQMKQKGISAKQKGNKLANVTQDVKAI